MTRTGQSRGGRRRRITGLVLGLALVALAAVPRSGATGVSRDDDPEERAEREVRARRAVEENCLSCHGQDMIALQRLTAAQWKAEVEKMVGWGAPLPAEMQAPVADYLFAHYPATAPPAPLPRTSYAAAWDRVRPAATPAASPPGDAERGGPLYARHCANCHGPDGQGAELGTNLVEKPVLLRPADFSDPIRAGRGRMPAFGPVVKPDEEAAILAWLRTRTYRPPDLK